MSEQTDELLKSVLGLDNLPFDSRMDMGYFMDQPNASVSRTCLKILSNRRNEAMLRRHHTSDEMVQMWRTTLRNCLAHGVPLSDNQKQYARMLGVNIAAVT